MENSEFVNWLFEPINYTYDDFKITKNCKAVKVCNNSVCRLIYSYGVTRIKPRSAANAHDRHLNVPNINTPWKSAIKRLVLNI